MNRKGFSSIAIIPIIVAVMITIGVYYYYFRPVSPLVTPQSSPSSSAEIANTNGTTACDQAVGQGKSSSSLVLASEEEQRVFLGEAATKLQNFQFTMDAARFVADGQAYLTEDIDEGYDSQIQRDRFSTAIYRATTTDITSGTAEPIRLTQIPPWLGGGSLGNFSYSSDTLFFTAQINNGAHSSSTLFAINAKTGRTIWALQDNDIYSPVLYGGSIYFTSQPGLTKVDSATGKEIWHFADAGTGLPPLPTPSAIYVDYENNEGVGFYEIDPTTGAALKQFPTASIIHGWDQCGDSVYIIESGANSETFFRVDPATGALKNVGSLSD